MQAIVNGPGGVEQGMVKWVPEGEGAPLTECIIGEAGFKSEMDGRCNASMLCMYVLMLLQPISRGPHYIVSHYIVSHSFLTVLLRVYVSCLSFEQ